MARGRCEKCGHAKAAERAHSGDAAAAMRSLLSCSSSVASALGALPWAVASSTNAALTSASAAAVAWSRVPQDQGHNQSMYMSGTEGQHTALESHPCSMHAGVSPACLQAPLASHHSKTYTSASLLQSESQRKHTSAQPWPSPCRDSVGALSRIPQQSFPQPFTLLRLPSPLRVQPCMGNASCSLPSACPPHQLHQWRGYKSNKRSLKPLNTASSWKAVRSVLPDTLPSPTPTKPSSPMVDSCIPPIPPVPRPDPFTKVGRLTGQYSLDLHKTFAVVEVGGTQFKVTRDDVLFVNQLHGVDINDVLRLNRVLLLGSRAQTVVGRPYVPDASVLVAVEEHFRDGKVHVFKRNPRKRYRRYYGARQHLTTLRVLEVHGVEPAPGDQALEPVPALPIAWEDGSEDEEEALAGEEKQGAVAA